jgi:carbon monoxide dehydrogenase subunit G
MKKILETRVFQSEASSVWEIISDISRSDWVPGVESIKLDGNKRIFKMTGLGNLVEEIIDCDDSKMKLTYSAIETMAPIAHHLAIIQLHEDGNNTIFEWSTEIDPANFADAIHQGMVASLDQLEQILTKT